MGATGTGEASGCPVQGLGNQSIRGGVGGWGGYSVRGWDGRESSEKIAAAILPRDEHWFFTPNQRRLHTPLTPGLSMRSTFGLQQTDSLPRSSGASPRKVHNSLHSTRHIPHTGSLRPSQN